MSPVRRPRREGRVLHEQDRRPDRAPASPAVRVLSAEGSAYRLNQKSDFGDTVVRRPFAAAGPLLTYVQELLGADDAVFAVTVRDLRSGAVVHRGQNGTSGFAENVYSLVIGRAGAVAWTTYDSHPASGIAPAYQLLVLDQGTLRAALPVDSGHRLERPRLVAEGSNIRPRSLHLTADRNGFTWMGGDSEHTARFER